MPPQGTSVVASCAGLLEILIFNRDGDTVIHAFARLWQLIEDIITALHRRQKSNDQHLPHRLTGRPPIRNPRGLIKKHLAVPLLASFLLLSASTLADFQALHHSSAAL